MSSTVFISYARKEADLGAAPLDAALKPYYSVWRDVRDVDPAQDFTAEIENAIQVAQHFIVCVTPDILRKDSFVRREIAYASYLKKPILVARFADLPPPIQVFTNTWLDFFVNWNAALVDLHRWLGGEPIRTTGRDSTPILVEDAYKLYLETLYAELIDSLRASVFSDDSITLSVVETTSDVPRRLRSFNPKFITFALRDNPTDYSIFGSFSSLHDAYESMRCERRVLLLGDPGAGKTTTLLAFARDMTAARLNDPAKPLPVFARIAGWDSFLQTPLHEWLGGMYGLDTNALKTIIEEGKVLLLLDGLDELGSRRLLDPKNPNGEEYDPRERFLRMLPPLCNIILSSRLEDYRQIGTQADLTCAVRLAPLDDMQMQAYLSNSNVLWEVVSADSGLRDALRTPLLLALFRIGFEDTSVDVQKLHDLSTGDLNERIWDVFIDKRWAHEQARLSNVPLPFTAAELKWRLGTAVLRVMSDRFIKDYTRILAADIGGTDALQVVELASRLDMLRHAGDVSVSLWPKEQTYTPSFHFLHLRLRDALAFSVASINVRSQDWTVRTAAIRALGFLSDDRAVDILLAGLDDVSASVREQSADSLRHLGSERAVERLIHALQDPSSSVRSSVVVALARIRDPRAIDPLVATLSDKKRNVGLLSAYALGVFGERAIPPLIAALKHMSPLVRSGAIRALGIIGGTGVMDTLASALDDQDIHVRSEAIDAIERLNNQRYSKEQLK